MSSPQINWDSAGPQIQWDDERPGVPKPPNPILNAPTPSALSRGATAFGAAAGDLLNSGSSMYAGGTPGESFTPEIGSPAEKLAKSGDWKGAVKESVRESEAGRPGPLSEIGGAVKGLGSMIASPIERAAGGDVAGGIGEGLANYPALIGNPKAREVAADLPEKASAGVRSVGSGMKAHPDFTGHAIGMAAAESVGVPWYIGGLAGQALLRKPVRAIGERLSNFRKPAEIPPPFSDVGDFSKDVFRENPQPQVASPKPVEAAPPEPAPQIGTPAAERIPGVGPHTLSGESALRQVLTGQDNKALIQIAKSRGLNVAQESQLKPGVADNRIIGKIIDSFTPEELEEMRSQYIENTRMGRSVGNIGAEAYKTKSLQTYFPELKIPQARLARTAKAVEKSRIATPKEGDLTGILTESLENAKKNKASKQGNPNP